MLAKENRLTRQKDFDNAFKVGRGFFNQLMGIKVAQNTLGINRFGIMVGNKVSKKAVVRNQIKRRIRAQLRPLSASLNIGYDVVIITLPPIKEADFAEIEKTLVNCFKKTKLWAPSRV